MANHLVLRGTTYHARVDIPVDVQPALGGRKVLSQSLKTGNKFVANRLARLKVTQWKGLFDSIRQEKLASRDIWREELSIQSGSMQQGLKQLAMMSVTRPNTLVPMQLDVDDEWQKLSEADRAPMLEKYRALSSAFSSGKLDRIAYMQQSAELDKQVILLAKKQQYKLTPEEVEDALLIANNPASYKSKSPISTAAIESFQKYQEEQTDNSRTISVILSKLKRFGKWLEKSGHDLNFDTVAQYLDDQIGSKRQTRQGHLWGLRAFHSWAIRYHKPYREQFNGLISPFDNHSHPRTGKAKGESWIPYTTEEVERLHKAALDKGDSHLAHLIAIASYTGCRLEEIGRIHRDNIILTNGLPTSFKIEEAKSKAGIREVPVHSAIIPLLQRLLQDSQDGYLLQGRADKDGRRLNAASQRFTKLKRAAGFSDLHVFHSIRKTAATQLEQAGVSPLIIPALLGHDVGHISFDIYSAGASMKQKTDAIEKLNYNFNEG